MSEFFKNKSGTLLLHTWLLLWECTGCSTARKLEKLQNIDRMSLRSRKKLRCDGKDQGEGSPKQACSYWFARSNWLAPVARTMRYYLSMTLSVSHRGVLCHWFCWSLSLPTGMLPLNWLHPSIYDIEMVVQLLLFIVFFRMGFLTLWPRAGSLRSAYVRILSINQCACTKGSEFESQRSLNFLLFLLSVNGTQTTESPSEGQKRQTPASLHRLRVKNWSQEPGGDDK